MRRSGHYADSGAGVYMQHMSAQRMENRSESDHFQGRLEAFTPERDHPYVTSKADGQWRASQMYNEGQGVDASRSQFLGKGLTLEQKSALEKHDNNDHRFGHREEDMQVGFEDKPMLQTFEGLEQKFSENLTNLVKEQYNAEDAENSRHREKINTINAQYEEKLAALRARHSTQRDEILRKEALVRQHQYQEVAMGPHGYMAPMNEVAHRAGGFESYRDRQFLGSQGFEPRGSGAYQGGRAYDTNPRYY